MSILNNLSSTHYDYIKGLLLEGNEFHIVSPFLMESFDAFIAEAKKADIKYITLTTTLKDNDPDLFHKANSLYSFCVNCLKEGIDYSIYIDNQLHGKIYISSTDGVPTQGIVTSANFTNAGLEKNHEWGLILTDQAQVEKIQQEIFSVRGIPLTAEDIANIIIKIDDYVKQAGIPQKAKIDLMVSNIIDSVEKVDKAHRSYFIKPVGWLEKPFSTSRVLSHDIETLHFSRRKPAAVKAGDIIICYGVGTTKLLGYFETLEDPVHSGVEGARWPWSVKAKNLLPKYSGQWNNYNNTISSIQASYNSQTPITHKGGGTLGALNFGADKIRLTREFANHVIETMKSS